MSDAATSLKIEVSLKCHLKPWLAMITGTDQKYGFARRFCRPEVDHSRSGITTYWSWDICEPGLYQLGGAEGEDRLILVWLKDGQLARTPTTMARVKEMARLMTARQSFEEARQATRTPK